jgi:hypothetical protein
VKRSLPTEAEAREILARRRTRPQRRPPPPAGRKLNRFIKELDDRFGQGAHGLAARWREIAGEALAKSTEPVRLIKPKAGGGATLEIRVEGPAAALIQHQAPQIFARANLFLGEGAVAKLRIIQGPVRRPGPASRPSKRKLAPLDAAKESELSKSVDGAADDALKASLLKLGREVLRRG